jgi:hypothetical protein
MILTVTMVLQFSAELESRLKGRLSPSLFATRG